MTSETRAALKQAVSEAQKLKLANDRKLFKRCVGCGGGLLERTVGCVNCMHRDYDRRKRAEALLAWSASL